MHDLAHDLVHPDRQDKHKIRYCLRQIFDARLGVSLLVFTRASSLSASALSLGKEFPMLLLKMLILPRKFEKLALCVAHAAGELRLQIHDHLLHLVGMRTHDLLLPRRGMNSFRMSLPSLSMFLPLNKWFAQLDLFRGMILACPFSILRSWRPSRICNAILFPLKSVRRSKHASAILGASDFSADRPRRPQSMSMHCNCVTSTVCVPVCVTGPWRCICRNLTDFDDVCWKYPFAQHVLPRLEVVSTPPGLQCLDAADHRLSAV